MMNKTEVVVRMLQGEIFRDDIMYLRIKDGKLQMNSVNNDPNGGWVNWYSGCDYLSEPSLRIVEPQPKIEEAIERETNDALTYSVDRDANAFHVEDRVQKAMRRVVNLALDLAKAAAVTGNIKLVELNRETLARIDALKVKE